MSLQPGINPLERIRTPMAPGMRTMEVRDQHSSFPSAEEMERRMERQHAKDAKLAKKMQAKDDKEHRREILRKENEEKRQIAMRKKEEKKGEMMARKILQEEERAFQAERARKERLA